MQPAKKFLLLASTTALSLVLFGVMYIKLNIYSNPIEPHALMRRDAQLNTSMDSKAIPVFGVQYDANPTSHPNFKQLDRTETDNGVQSNSRLPIDHNSLNMSTVYLNVQYRVHEMKYECNRSMSELSAIYFDQSNRVNAIKQLYLSLYVGNFTVPILNNGNSTENLVKPGNCDDRNALAKQNYATIWSIFSYLDKLTAEEIRNLRSKINTIFSLVTAEFKSISRQLQLSFEKNSSGYMIASFRSKINQLTAELDKMDGTFNLNVDRVLERARREVTYSVDQFSVSSAPFIDTIEAFQPLDWEQCYTNFHAMDGIIHEILYPATDLFFNRSSAVIRAMKKTLLSIFETSEIKAKSKLSALEEICSEF